MKRVITKKQFSDMGSGRGYIDELNNHSLLDVLNFISTTKKCGLITIYYKDTIIRKFDYNLYSDNNYFYHSLDWEYNLPVIKVNFIYCFNVENYEIYLEASKND